MGNIKSKDYQIEPKGTIPQINDLRIEDIFEDKDEEGSKCYRPHKWTSKDTTVGGKGTTRHCIAGVRINQAMG